MIMLYPNRCYNQVVIKELHCMLWVFKRTIMQNINFEPALEVFYKLSHMHVTV